MDPPEPTDRLFDACLRSSLAASLTIFRGSCVRHFWRRTRLTENQNQAPWETGEYVTHSCVPQAPVVPIGFVRPVSLDLAFASHEPARRCRTSSSSTLNTIRSSREDTAKRRTVGVISFGRRSFQVNCPCTHVRWRIDELMRLFYRRDPL